MTASGQAGGAAPDDGRHATLVFLHPIGLDSRCAGWLSVEGIVAPTLPGHGARCRPRPGMTLDDMADEIVGWTVGPLDVVGALLGGAVALHLALRHPDRVRSMLVAGTGARTNGPMLRNRAGALEGQGSGHVNDMLSRWFEPELLRAVPSHQGVEYARGCLAGMDRASLAAIWRALAEHDVTREIGGMGVPITWVAGRRDVVHRVEEVESYSRAMPRSRLMVLEASHMIPLDDPAGFSEAIQEHLAWVATMSSSANGSNGSERGRELWQ